MAQTTATGFLRWLARFEKETNEKRTEHYYSAQLSSEVACLPYLVWGKEPPAELREIKNFLLTFGTQEEMERKAAESSEQRKIRDGELSRSIWLGAFGIELGPDGKPIPRNKDGLKKPPLGLPGHIGQHSPAPQNAATAPTGDSQPPQQPAPTQTAPPQFQRRRTQVEVRKK